jgi:hypothetical protein
MAEEVSRRYGSARPAVPGSSALSDFLKHTKIYDVTKAVMPKDLVQFGLYGSGVLMATALIALLLPDPSSIRSTQVSFIIHAHLFFVGRALEATIVGLLQALAIPAIVASVVLLALDIYLMQVPTSQEWRYAVVGQAVAGGLNGVLGVIFLALLLFNLAMWIAMTCLIIGGCLVLIGMILSGGGG